MTDEKIMQTSNTVDKQFLMGHCPGSLPTHAVSLSWNTRFQEHGNLIITGTPEMDLI